MRSNRTTSHRKINYLQALPCDENMNTGRISKQLRQPASAGTLGERDAAGWLVEVLLSILRCQLTY